MGRYTQDGLMHVLYLKDEDLSSSLYGGVMSFWV